MGKEKEKGRRARWVQCFQKKKKNKNKKQKTKTKTENIVNGRDGKSGGANAWGENERRVWECKCLQRKSGARKKMRERRKGEKGAIKGEMHWEKSLTREWEKRAKCVGVRVLMDKQGCILLSRF